MEYEQVFLKGVPFLRDTDGIIYNYDRAHPIAIGRLDTGGELCLAADWRERLEPALIAWRASQKPKLKSKVSPEKLLAELEGAQQQQQPHVLRVKKEDLDQFIQMMNEVDELLRSKI
jgi:hypothetical protein